MQKNEACFSDGSRGSVVLITSTSGYFGSSGVGAYVASKHALVGLLRSSQLTARALNVKVSAVAPFFTPTRTFSKLSERWAASGLNANTLDEVANTIARVALAPSGGKCVLVLLTLLNMDLGAPC
jgi:NAD(P)-dependent dehydrogenase (short-subunit alcohol dehydrogenase family)